MATEKILKTINAADHEIKLVENTNGMFFVVDAKYIFNDYLLTDFCHYYTQAKFTALRKMYRDLATERDKDPKATFKNAIKTIVKNLDDFFDFGKLAAKDWSNDFIKGVCYANIDVDGEWTTGKSVSKADGKKLVEILTDMFDANEQLNQLSKRYGEYGDQTVREQIAMNDTSLRKMYNIPKDQSLFDKVF